MTLLKCSSVQNKKVQNKKNIKKEKKEPKHSAKQKCTFTDVKGLNFFAVNVKVYSCKHVSQFSCMNFLGTV